MHSHIAAGRFVHIGGYWFARALHPLDPGPQALQRREDGGFCSSQVRAVESSPILRAVSREALRGAVRAA